MSRRHSRRTVIDADTPQAWFAHWWKDEWAEETLRICEIVYHQKRKTLMSGAYLTPRFQQVSDHFKEWLVEQALEFRAKFDPFRPSTKGSSLEEQWYGALHATLSKYSQWHFWHYCREHGINEEHDPQVVWTTESTDQLTEEVGEAWAGDRYRQNQDVLLQDPARIIVLLEKLLTGPTAADIIEGMKSPGLCKEYGCRRPKRARGLCGAHYEQHRQLWGLDDTPRCAEEGCTDYAMRRDRCRSHYAQLRNQLIAAGEWDPREPTRDDPCEAEGCEEKVGTKGARGMCPRHYRDWAASQRPTCTVEACDRQARGSKGMCTMHYQRLRKTGTTDAPVKEIPMRERKCLEVECESLVGRSGGLGRCRAHHVAYLRAAADPCIVQDCSEPGWRKGGLCNGHYQRMLKDRKRNREAK